MTGKQPKKPAGTFTAAERAAMRERARELARGASAADGERDVLAKFAAMTPVDRAIAERLHAIVKVVAPGLVPRTWYGMPAYAKGDQVLFFFQDSKKFKARYATLGFSDKARLDDGAMWPVAYALTELNATVEARLTALVKRAVSG